MPRMSRTKKANRIIKKEVFKSCLVAVLIGAIGTAGSFAYFKSSAEVKPDLEITTGSIDVALENHKGEASNTLINIDKLLPPGSSSTSSISGKSEFKIKNTGTLNQEAEIYFSNLATEIPSEVLKGISYDIIFKDGNTQIGSKKSGNLDELMKGEKIIISDNQGSPIAIKNGKEITCDFQVTLNKSIDDKYKEKAIKFAVNTKVIQANNSKGLN